MKTKILSQVVLLLFPVLLQAAINPVYKECMQREYSVDGDYCVFPDSTRCLLEDFNSGKCGKKWMTDDYCIKEGKYVWDAEKCCPGLVAYLPEGVAGQATCVLKSKVDSVNLMSNSLLWMGLLVAGLLALLIFLRKKSNRSS